MRFSYNSQSRIRHQSFHDRSRQSLLAAQSPGIEYRVECANLGSQITRHHGPDHHHHGNYHGKRSVPAGFIDLSGVIITDNGPMDAGLDVDLGFGTRALLTGNTINILYWDATVVLSPEADVVSLADN